jgi:TatD DNase family protein
MLVGKKGRELAAAMPQKRVLTETDGPFAQVNGRPLKPTDVGAAEMELATIWGLPLVETQNRLKESFRTLVDLHQ